MTFNDSVTANAPRFRRLLRDLAGSYLRPVRRMVFGHAEELLAVLGLKTDRRPLVLPPPINVRRWRKSDLGEWSSLSDPEDESYGGFGLFANVHFCSLAKGMPPIYERLCALAPEHVGATLARHRSTEDIPALNCALVLEDTVGELEQILCDHDPNWRYFDVRVRARLIKFTPAFEATQTIKALLTLLALGWFLPYPRLESIVRRILDDWKGGNWFVGVSPGRPAKPIFYVERPIPAGFKPRVQRTVQA